MPENLLRILINSSEKAANIARRCRADEKLLSLLVEKKSASEANPRFVDDFKTLADVLIQETLRYEVSQKFPQMKDNIFGEESATFTNTLGNSITVNIGSTLEETIECLETVLNGKREVAEALAFEVHRETEWPDIGNSELPELPNCLDYTQLGIWIDPIDGTAEYIAGETIFSNFPGITSTGLDCVTVLIGVFDMNTGEPVLGIINQPFAKTIDSTTYKSTLFWGISIGNLVSNNIDDIPNVKPSKVALLSSSEHVDVIGALRNAEFEIAFSAGAGHKCLKVIVGEADVYLLSKSSTFKWDTCGPHGILKSMGGVLLNFRASIEARKPVFVSYKVGLGKCNDGGLIALRDINLFENILKIVSPI